MAINLALAPGDQAANPATIAGTKRTYSCAKGSVILVPDFDAPTLISAGWVATGASASVIATPVRPSNPRIGTIILDTTLNIQVVYLGPKSGWVHHGTGASA